MDYVLRITGAAKGQCSVQHTVQDGLRSEEDPCVFLEQILSSEIDLLSFSGICGIVPVFNIQELASILQHINHPVMSKHASMPRHRQERQPRPSNAGM